MDSNVAFQELRNAKARYCRFVDTKQWAALKDVLFETVEILVYDLSGKVVASFNMRDAFVTVCRDFLDGTQSSHQIHNEELTLVSAREIRAIWSMEDNVIFPIADPQSDARPARLHGHGHYYETWVLCSDGWRLSRMELRRSILEITSK